MKELIERQPLFIFGCTRGGTTLLRLMLNSHSEIAVPPESHFLISILEKYDPKTILNTEAISDVLNIIKNHPRFKFWAVEKEQLLSLKRKVGPSVSLAKLIDGVFRLQIEKEHKPIWGDKTPENFVIISSLIKLYPEGKFIAYTRDGRDVAVSLKKRGWYGRDIYQRARYWEKTINQTFKLKDNDNAIFVKYEDLVLDPQDSLKLICKFLGVSFEYQMLEYDKDYKKYITKSEKQNQVHKKLSRKPRKSDINKWKAQSSKFEIWKFESVAYRALIKAGYELKYYKSENYFHRIGAGLYSMSSKLISVIVWTSNLPIFRPFTLPIKRLIKRKR